MKGGKMGGGKLLANISFVWSNKKSVSFFKKAPLVHSMYLPQKAPARLPEA